MVHSSTTEVLLNKGMNYCTVRPIKSQNPNPVYGTSLTICTCSCSSSSFYFFQIYFYFRNPFHSFSPRIKLKNQICEFWYEPYQNWAFETLPGQTAGSMKTWPRFFIRQHFMAGWFSKAQFSDLPSFMVFD